MIAHRLPMGATVAETLALFSALYRRPLTVEAALAVADIEPLARRQLHRLSGGEAQRVRFALAVVGNPELIFLDEPTVGMDVAARRGFWSTMRAWAAGGRTLLFATHYLEEVEAAADRLVLLNQGQVIADAAPAALRAGAGFTTVRMARPVTADTARLRSLPGVVEVHDRGDTVELRTADPDATLPALYRRYKPRGVEVAASRLDDVFARLTEEVR